MVQTNSTNMKTPDGFTCIGYKSLYPDTPFSPEEVLKSLPLFDTLHFILQRQNEVQYTLGSIEVQKNKVYEMYLFICSSAKTKLIDAIALFPNIFLFSNMANIQFVMMAMEFCQNESRNLKNEEIEKIYMTYLFCNDSWSDKQASGIMELANNGNLPGMYLMADVPIIEFKFHKDFKPQIFKAGQLFRFMESNSPYTDYLNMFYNDQQICNWRDYINILLSFYSSTLNNCIVNVEEANQPIRTFLDKMCINLVDCAHIWEDQNIKYLREHPLLKAKEGFYIVLNPNFVVDRIYQALKFSIFAAMEKYGALNKKGKAFKDFPEFSSMLGNDFSETEIFYSGINKTFKGNAEVMFSGNDLKNEHIPAEPDFYIRDGKIAYVFEYKDIIISDIVKQSGDFDTIKNTIFDRICKDDGKPRKGIGQILYTINEIINNKSLIKLDSDSIYIENIYPIIVTTDKTFSSLGVAYYIIEKTNEIVKIFYSL